MSTLLPEGGTVSLWGGWSIGLPPSHHLRNEDGSWSAWGTDWAIDITILEVSSDPSGLPATPEKLLGHDRPVTVSGEGWIGSAKTLREEDQGKTVYRLAVWLAAPNTLMSCWISYFTESQSGFAEQLIKKIAHDRRKA